MTFFRHQGVYNFLVGVGCPLETTVIYADILFITNFIIDGLCLAVSLIVAAKPLYIWRFLMACAAGGIYAIVAVQISSLPWFITLLIHILAAFLICFIALKKPSFKDTAWLGVLFFFCNALLGGVLTAVYSILGRFAVYRGVFYAEISAVALIVGAVGVCTAVLFAISKSKARCRATHADIDIEFRGKKLRLFCLCDSGSLLRCPYTGFPVVTVKESAVASFFKGSDEELEFGFRYIPVQSVGGGCLLPSFVPDKATVRTFGEREFRTVRLCVAIDKNKNNLGGCDGLMPSVLL